MRQQLLAKLDRLDEEPAGCGCALDNLAVPYEEVLRRLSTIPVVDRTAALVRLAEFSEDMTEFPTAGHLASWADSSPVVKIENAVHGGFFSGSVVVPIIDGRNPCKAIFQDCRLPQARFCSGARKRDTRKASLFNMPNSISISAPDWVAC
jgi:hypothetical protein